ncbi:MAG TPA: outer membrane lipoprotein carrier protein LolA [Saprospiraceae bacterium]|nr:outer membrane lipoprotein carrier protein LolA [Saprospiraceae bacterium]
MKSILLLVILCFTFCLQGYSQYLTAKDSDPEALKILTSASEGFKTKNARLNFNLRISYPGKETETNEGVLYQAGKNYRLELKDYIILSDGTTRWLYLKGPNEVNIYNESNGQDWISPQDFLQLYASKELVFILASKKPDGTAVIEAKPLKGRFEDYSKFTIGIKNGALSYINGLSSDGTRQEMSITNVTFPATWDAAKLFTFQPASYPGVHIEDLRLD